MNAEMCAEFVARKPRIRHHVAGPIAATLQMPGKSRPSYTVILLRTGQAECECPGYAYRKTCSHVVNARVIAIETAPIAAVLEFPALPAPRICPACGMDTAVPIHLAVCDWQVAS